MKIKLEVTEYEIVEGSYGLNKVYGVVDDIEFMAQREKDEDKDDEEWEWGNGISYYYRNDPFRTFDKNTKTFLQLNAKAFDDLRRKYRNIFTDALDQWEISYWKHYRKNVEIAEFTSVEDANCDFGYKKETA